LYTFQSDFLRNIHNEIITGGIDFTLSGMILLSCCEKIEANKKGVCMQKGEVSHYWDPFFY